MTQPITLGELIELLEARPADQDVIFDFGGFVPGDVGSYRGYYDHLAVHFEAHEELAECKVRGLIDRLRNAIGIAFQGYKGGSYVMDLDTPVWAANWGRCTSTAIVGLAACEYRTVLATAWVDC